MCNINYTRFCFFFVNLTLNLYCIITHVWLPFNKQQITSHIFLLVTDVIILQHFKLNFCMYYAVKMIFLITMATYSY